MTCARIYRARFGHENARFRENMPKTLIFNPIRTHARIYRPSFNENKPKTLVFSHTKRAFQACFRENWVYNFGHQRCRLQLVLDEISLRVVFKYWNCVEEEISWFSCPRNGHIRWQVFTKSVEFVKVECSSKIYMWL